MSEIITTPLGGLHAALASLALIAGARVLIWPKGDSGHKRWGYVYVLAMTVQLLATVPDAFDGLSVFHYLGIVSGVSLTGGMSFILLSRLTKRPAARAGLVYGHYKFMAWSYAGLVAAGVAQVATRIAVSYAPSLAVFWWSVLFASLGTIALAALIIGRADKMIRRRYAPAMGGVQA